MKPPRVGRTPDGFLGGAPCPRPRASGAGWRSCSARPVFWALSRPRPFPLRISTSRTKPSPPKKATTGSKPAAATTRRSAKTATSRNCALLPALPSPPLPRPSLPGPRLSGRGGQADAVGRLEGLRSGARRRRRGLRGLQENGRQFAVPAGRSGAALRLRRRGVPAGIPSRRSPRGRRPVQESAGGLADPQGQEPIRGVRGGADADPDRPPVGPRREAGVGRRHRAGVRLGRLQRPGRIHPVPDARLLQRYSDDPSGKIRQHRRRPGRVAGRPAARNRPGLPRKARRWRPDCRNTTASSASTAT